MSLTITTATGSRTIDAFQVKRDELPRELRGERAKGTTRTLAYGDRGKRPNALVIEVEVQEATVNATATEAGAIISDAESAKSVTTPRGLRSVNGVLWHEMKYAGPAITLTLAFAPTEDAYWSDTLITEGGDTVTTESGDSILV